MPTTHTARTRQLKGAARIVSPAAVLVYGLLTFAVVLCIPWAAFGAECQIDPENDSDCNTNGTADTCEIADVGHSCCEAGTEPGCSEPTIEACVCSGDSFCCEGAWDDLCAAQVETFGCGFCTRDCNTNGQLDECDIFAAQSDDCNSNGTPDECDVLLPSDSDCCKPDLSPGCSDPAIEACVCAVDSFCCEAEWDDACVQEIETLECASCSSDCNGNGVLDECDIVSGSSSDGNGNAVPDECDPDSGGGTVTLQDYPDFADCMAGPHQSPNPSRLPTAQDCLDKFDTDLDDDLDLLDAAEFFRLVSG